MGGQHQENGAKILIIVLPLLARGHLFLLSTFVINHQKPFADSASDDLQTLSSFVTHLLVQRLTWYPDDGVHPHT